jgi:CHAT domain-containing protein
VESCSTSHCASIYSAHLDGANIYNLSSLVRSHPQPAFSDPAICWKSIDKLAEALIGLFTTKQNQHGLIDAIQLCHVSLATLPQSSACMSSSLHKIASAIVQIGAEQSDVEVRDTIECMIGPLDDGNPLHFRGLSYLSLHGIAEHITKPNSHVISSVKDWYRKSFSNIDIDILCRLQIALACARITENIGEADFSLEVYETSLQLLQLHVSATHMGTWAEPVEHLSTSLAVDAAAAALHLGEVNNAVELLEWGRELLWAYIAQSHTNEGGEKQISEVDRMPCSRRSFSDMLKATQDGPVVMLLASRRSCDAIIVSNAYTQAIHVPLKTSLSSLVELSTTFQACTSAASENSESVEKQLKGVLRYLWVNVVAPVIDRLKNLPPNSRIWWCPTSVFSALPVHAAGEYTSEGKQLSRLYVSSYTSSIVSLLRARTCTDHPRSFSEFAAIYQAKPLQNDEQKEVEYPAIEFAEMEPDIAKRNLPASLSFTRFADATKEDASEAFEDRGWFHLTAYATQNAYQPLNSSFLMRDGSLSIPDILSADLGKKEFAFLSVRPVGSRFSWMQNEIIQLAAGLQISGFKSIVGTMGDVDDSKANEIIDKFYRAFFLDELPDCTRAAQALHDALEEMADGGFALRQIIAFAHFGL